MRDPEVVEGPTRPICPPSDPVSCLPHPRDVVPAPLPYQDITHRTHIGLKPHSESLGDSCLPFCACGCFSQVRPADTPRAAAASDSSCAAFFEMPEVLGSTGSWSFVVVSAGLRARSGCDADASKVSLETPLLSHMTRTCKPSSLRHERRGATARRAVTTVRLRSRQ